MTSTGHLLRRSLVGACVLVLLTGVAVVFPGRSGAASTFSASAGGEIVRAVVKLVPALLAEEILDPGAVTAQASLTSFGESTAFASTPYPGAVPVSAPGLVDGLLGSTPAVPPEVTQLVNVPDYPLIASTSYPGTPSSNVTVGPLSMDAQSRERESSATTTDGINRSEARITADSSDVVTARATSVVGAVDLGPLVQLGGVRSAATVTQTASGDLERSTDFSVASLSVLGTQLRVTNDGIELAALKIPGGLGQLLDPVEQLLSALQQQGTSIRFVDAEQTTDGVISSGLVIQSTFETGLNGIVATVTMTLGRTFASVSNTARGGLDEVDLSGGSGVDLGSTPALGGAGFVADLPSVGASGGVVNRPGSVGSTVRTERIRALTPDRTDAGRFYPVVALGGAVFVIGISLFRKIGVRSTWTS